MLLAPKLGWSGRDVCRFTFAVSRLGIYDFELDAEAHFVGGVGARVGVCQFVGQRVYI